MSEEQIDRLHYLWFMKRLSINQIAKDMGLRPEMVRSKLVYMGWLRATLSKL
jgi:hypothetical protein